MVITGASWEGIGGTLTGFADSNRQHKLRSARGQHLLKHRDLFIARTARVRTPIRDTTDTR
jgi:hypothetical protein